MEDNKDVQRWPRRPAPAEFARMSSSMKLTVIAILRAQMSSRQAVDAAASIVRPPVEDES